MTANTKIKLLFFFFKLVQTKVKADRDIDSCAFIKMTYVNLYVCLSNRKQIEKIWFHVFKFCNVQLINQEMVNTSGQNKLRVKPEKHEY